MAVHFKDARLIGVDAMRLTLKIFDKKLLISGYIFKHSSNCCEACYRRN